MALFTPASPDPSVGSGISAPSGVWSFGGGTPAAFDDHVRRSIPGYAECHALILDLAEQLCPPGGRCYDLGCSTGALTWRLSERLSPRGVEVIGVDREPGMIEQAETRERRGAAPTFVVAPIEEMQYEPTDLIVCFYTLQFVALRERRSLLARLCEALRPQGALVLFEKTLGSSGREEAINQTAYADFKRRQGFTSSEIFEKSRSLRGILQPLSATENLARIRVAGFDQVVHVFRWLMFDGLVAWPASSDPRRKSDVDH